MALLVTFKIVTKYGQEITQLHSTNPQHREEAPQTEESINEGARVTDTYNIDFQTFKASYGDMAKIKTPFRLYAYLTTIMNKIQHNNSLINTLVGLL